MWRYSYMSKSWNATLKKMVQKFLVADSVWTYHPTNQRYHVTWFKEQSVSLWCAFLEPFWIAPSNLLNGLMTQFEVIRTFFTCWYLTCSTCLIQVPTSSTTHSSSTNPQVVQDSGPSCFAWHPLVFSPPDVFVPPPTGRSFPRGSPAAPGRGSAPRGACRHAPGLVPGRIAASDASKPSPLNSGTVRGTKWPWKTAGIWKKTRNQPEKHWNIRTHI